jgi:hypothetical protein
MILKKRNAYSLLVGNSEGKRPLGRTRYRREYNIGMDIELIGCCVMNWIDLV